LVVEKFVSEKKNSPMLILIAGPYRSGTNDDPDLIRKNVADMESYALPIFRAGHIPILGEWLALPLVVLAGSRNIGDESFNEIFHPIAVRLLEKCDAVLRVGGPSAGADEMVRVARNLGLTLYNTLAEIPKL
jgi:GDP-mannose pyrophosphatase NudK